MQVEQITDRPASDRQPDQPPRKSRHVFAVLAACIIAMLLVGSAFVVVTNIRSSGNPAAQPSATPEPTVTQPTGFTPFPAQDCPVMDMKYSGNSWYQLCLANQFVNVNQSVSPAHGVQETIKAAYADRNMLFLICQFSPLSPQKVLVPFNSAQTQQGEKLLPVGGGSSVRHGQATIWLAIYDTSNLPADLQVLTLQVTSRLSYMTYAGAPIYPGYSPLTFAPFRVPFHAIQVITTRQTVTANGIALTLETARVGSTVTQLFLSAQPASYALYRQGFKGVLQTGVGSASYSATFHIDALEAVPTGFALWYQSDLSGEQNTWTLTMTSPGKPQPWIFHFAVP